MKTGTAISCEGIRDYVHGGWRAHMPAPAGAAMISGYMGSSHAFDDAICEFAVEYADQNQCDYRALVKAVREERVKAVVES